MDLVLDRLEGLSLPWNGVIRLTDRVEITIAVYHERKATT